MPVTGMAFQPVCALTGAAASRPPVSAVAASRARRSPLPLARAWVEWVLDMARRSPDTRLAGRRLVDAGSLLPRVPGRLRRGRPASGPTSAERGMHRASVSEAERRGDEGAVEAEVEA